MKFGISYNVRCWPVFVIYTASVTYSGFLFAGVLYISILSYV